MGASNSKPQTVNMVNKAPIQITRDVAERIQKTTKLNATTTDTVTSKVSHSSGSGQFHCEKCNSSTIVVNSNPQNTPTLGIGTTTCTTSSYSRSSTDGAINPCSSAPHKMAVPAVAVVPWQKRSIEIEETQFDKTLDRVHKLFGKPVKWAKECSGDIFDMEKRLALCYRDFPDAPLKCAQLAKQYHSFVFTKQFDEMTKSETQEKDANSKESNPVVDLEPTQDPGFAQK